MSRLPTIAAVSFLMLLSILVIGSFTNAALSQEYKKEWTTSSIVTGVYDLGGSSGKQLSFSIASDGTDARIDYRYEGHGGNSIIAFKVADQSSCSDIQNFNTCSRMYLREEKALGQGTLFLDAGKTYRLEFWNLDWFGTKQVETNIVLGYNKLVQVSSGSSGGGKCLIATAAFGSELTPQVQFLRNFRDNHILSTSSGSSFMNAFNAWYYSFSPAVADFERQQPWMQYTVRVAIYPLLGILELSEKAYLVLPGEYGSLSAGMVASSLIGAVYVTPIVLSVQRIRSVSLDWRIAAIIVTIGIISVLVSLSLANEFVLMATTSIFVLSTLSIAAILSANTITRIAQKGTSVKDKK